MNKFVILAFFVVIIINSCVSYQTTTDLKKDMKIVTIDYLKNTNIVLPILIILRNGDTLFGQYENFKRMPLSDYGQLYDAYRINIRSRVNLPARYDSLVIFAAMSKEYVCQMIGFEKGKIVVRINNTFDVVDVPLRQIDSIFWVCTNSNIQLDTINMLTFEPEAPKMTQIQVYIGDTTISISVNDIKEIYQLNINGQVITQIIKEQAMVYKLKTKTNFAEYDEGYYDGEMVGSQRGQIKTNYLDERLSAHCCCIGAPGYCLVAMSAGDAPYIIPNGGLNYQRGYVDGYRNASLLKKKDDALTRGVGSILYCSLFIVAAVVMAFWSMP